MTVTCGTCRFDKAASNDQAQYISAAFVLLFAGRSLDQVLKSTAERAEGVVVPGCTSYCPTCTHITWLARDEDCAAALMRHEYDFARNSGILKELEGFK